MIPPLIYGFNPGHQRLSMQIPTLTRFALKHGFAGHIGSGASQWSSIHVLDLARAYLTLLHYMEATPSSTFSDNPYFFAENGSEFSWREVAEQIGRNLHDAGLIPDPAPRSVDPADYADLMGDLSPLVLGMNSRSRAERLRTLGWESREKGWSESLRADELPELCREEGVEFNGYGVRESSVN